MDIENILVVAKEEGEGERGRTSSNLQDFLQQKKPLKKKTTYGMGGNSCK